MANSLEALRGKYTGQIWESWKMKNNIILDEEY